MCLGADVELRRVGLASHETHASVRLVPGPGRPHRTNGRPMPELLQATWRVDRPAEGFYTTQLPAAGRPVRTFLPTDYQPRYAYPLVVLFHGTGGSEESVGRLAPRMSRRNYIAI